MKILPLFSVCLTALLLSPLVELRADLEPIWAYELQGKTSLPAPWETVNGSLQSNVTDAVWTIIPLPGETTKFFRVIKRD